jgi:putative peptidoglycan lipid II flippase
VKRLLAFINRDIESVNQAALLLGITLLGSQLLGLIRDRVLASQLGPSDTLDIYYTAFRIPDILYAVAAAMVSVTILLPFFAELWDNKKKRAEARQFLSEILTVFLVFMVALSGVMYLLMPEFVSFIAPGFSESMLSELAGASRILLLSPILLGLSNIFGVVSQSRRAFLAFGLSPVMYNLGIIVGVLVLYPMFGLTGLIWGVILGALFHGLIQLPVLVRYQSIPFLTHRIQWHRIREVVSISIPRTLTLALTQLTITALLAIASLVGEGAVSVFTFARNIQTVPLALIGMTFSVAAFPTLVQTFVKRDYKRFQKHIIAPLRQIIFWSFPVMVLFIVLRAQIIRVILGAGEFGWDDTRLTAAVFALLVLSVVAQSAMLLFVRGYYAAGKTWRPFTINLITSTVTVLLGFSLYRLQLAHPELLVWLADVMRVQGVVGTEVLVLALAFAAGTILNALILWALFKREFLARVQTKVGIAFAQSLLISIGMGSVAYLMLKVGALFLNQDTLIGIFLQGAIAGTVAILLGAALFWKVENPEFMAIMKALRKKFWKSPFGGLDAGDGPVT